MIEDAELLRRYAEEKSEAAFAELVQRHVNFVYACALRRVGGDAHLAQDVTQSVFTALARNAAALAKREVLGGWFFTTVRNASAQIVRTERRRHAREQEAQTMNELTSVSVSDAEWQRLRPVLDDALDHLDERDREAILLRFFEGKSFADVGVKLHLAENSARMRVERALDKLQGLLARRGVTSTAAALAIVLTNQPMVAVPVGFAGIITGTALASVGTGSLLTTMLTSKLTLAAVGAVAAFAAGAAVYQTYELHQRDAELATATAAQQTLATKVHELELRVATETKHAQAVDEDNAKLLKVVAGMQSARAAQEAEKEIPITHDMVEARFRHAQDLARNGDPAEALKEFLWCYDIGMVRVTSYSGVRSSFLLSAIAKLGEQYPPAIEALKSRRDEAKKRMLVSATDNDAAMTFSSINRTLKDDQATLALYDELPADDGRRRAMASAAYEQLVAAQRYADAVIGRPYSSMSSLFELNSQERPIPANLSNPERVRQAQRTNFINSTATSIEVLAGAGDLEHARGLVTRLLAKDNSDEARMALQQHLARAGHPELLSTAPKS